MIPKPDKLMPSLYGGLLIATIWSVPGLNLLNCLCCAGVLLGGFLAVLLYQKDVTTEMEPLTIEDCKNIGIYTGIIASVAGMVIQFIIQLVFGNLAIDMMMKLAERMQVDFPPELYQMIEDAKQQGPNLFGSILAMFITVIPNTLFAFLGALIGWNVFKPKT
jgi:hypothetical protein